MAEQNQQFDQSQNAEETERRVELTAEYGTKLLFLSFYFSQGAKDLQIDFFQWLHLRYPNLRLLDEQKDAIYEKTVPVFDKFIPHIESTGPQYHKMVPRGEKQATMMNLQSEIETVLKLLKEVLNSNEREYPELIIKDIVDKIVEQDHKFALREEGRPREGTQDKNSFYADAFLSHFCVYVLLGAPTGLQDFDDMFSEIRTYIEINKEKIKTDPTSRGLYSKISDVVKMYNDHHPDIQVIF